MMSTELYICTGLNTVIIVLTDRHNLLALLMAETLLYHILFCIGSFDRIKPGV